MPDVKSSRREKAAQTRARIIEAAHMEFLERGFHGATIASVATRAGVATQTVYFVFHTKAALISAVIDAMVMAPDPATGEALPPELTPWWQEMVADPDPASSLQRFVRGVAPLYERAAAVSEVLRAAALTDDEVRRTHEHHLSLQREGFGGVVRMVAEKGTLRDGLDEARATDVLLTVFGDSTYHLLRTEHGWSHETVLGWFETVLPDLLLGPAG
jgi:AcrR family transcriptional regulator